MCRVNIPNSNFLTQSAYKTRPLLLISTKKHFSGDSLVDVSDIWSPTNRSYQIELEAIEEEKADCFTLL